MEQRTLVKWLKILVLFCSRSVDWDWQEVCCHWQASGWWRAIQNFPIASGRGSSFCGFCRFLGFWALYLAWKIFGNIEKDHAFTTENAEYMGRISFLAAAEPLCFWWEMCCSG